MITVTTLGQRTEQALGCFVVKTPDPTLQWVTDLAFRRIVPTFLKLGVLE